MSDIHIHNEVSTVEKDILKTLLYYDVFSHPLREEEIFHCSRLLEVKPQEIVAGLQELVRRGWVLSFGEFYGVRDIEILSERRQSNNRRAETFLRKARRISQFIGSFPYVRAVAISGSLSKHVIPEEDGDIDYFIITKPKRLWIARTTLVLFKKLFLFNSHKYFCVNYFIDTDHLEIEEKNLFTATELAYLIPTYGSSHYDTFYQANAWGREYFPHFPKRDTAEVPKSKRGIFKRLIESILNTSLGERLDAYFMKITVKHWDKKFNTLEQQDFDVALKSRKYVSKHHPQNFQRNVLDRHQERIQAFADKWGIKL